MIRGHRALYIWSFVTQVAYIVMTVFTSFLSGVLTDCLNDVASGQSFSSNYAIQSWVVNIITLGKGDAYLGEHLYIFPIAIAISGALAALMLCYRTITRVDASTKINKAMQMEVFVHLEKLPYTYYKQHKAGDILQTCTRDLDVLRRFLIMDMSSINYAFWIVLLCAGTLFSISWPYALVSMALFPIMFIYSFFLIKKVRRLYRLTDDSEARMTNKISENLNAVRIVKAYNAENYEIREFEKNLKDYRARFIDWRKFSSFFFASTDIFVFSAKAISIIFGVYLCYAHYVNGDAFGITYGTLVIGISFVNMMVWPIRQVSTVLSNLGQALASMDRVNEVLNTPIEDIESGLTPKITGNIEFDHVGFQYEDGDSEVIHDVSFSIKSGQSIAVMGKTGSGKSTLFYLLTRLYDYRGSIKIDGVELREIQKTYLRRNIVPVLQDPFLFSKTIYENIRLANKDATQKDIEWAARIAAVDDTIKSFKEGYNTPVGEKGVTLSGGQKQRVAIARTIMSNAPVLIFDDSLSAVDTATDIAIRSRLKSLKEGTTSIIITQRVMSAKDADLIIVLEDGRISEMGKHEDLVNKPGLYKDIYEIQSQMA